MSDNRETTDILIAGAGMTGGSLALALARRGFSVTLADSHSMLPAPVAGHSGFEPRVSAVNLASVMWLRHLQIWDEQLAQHACPFTDMHVWETDGTGSVDMSAAEIQTPALGYIIENRRISEALFRGVEASRITLLEYSPLTGLSALPDGRQQAIFQDGRSITADLVVGADGWQSVVREQAGIPVRQWSYGHQAIVTTVTLAQPHKFCARQVFTADGPLALLPLDQEGRYCSVVWSLNEQIADNIFTLPDDEFCRCLERTQELPVGTVLATDDRHIIPLSQCHAREYIRPGVALIGDAAHRIHPLAGQGVNLGFLDAATLTEVLEHSRSRQQSPGNEFYLARYQRQRQAHNLAMMAAMEGIKRLYEADPLPLRWLRNQGMKMFSQLPLLKPETIRMASGLSGPVPELLRYKA